MESRPPFEVADVFRQFGAAYCRAHKLSLKQHKVMRAITTCRTSAQGGHVERCSTCDYERISYNSCGDRHCPKCQGPKRRRWVAARVARLLPIEYFHVVFTLPGRLNNLIRHNERFCYDLLFRAAAQTLQAFAARQWGGRLGITMVLHTWGQNLSYHPHVHCLVTGGALSFDQSHWQSAPQGYLFPVKALARVFRGKYLAGLEKKRRELTLPEDSLIKAKGFSCWLREKRDWIVYAKAPFAGAEAVVRYIGHYTHRVAISNSRLLQVTVEGVQFRWKDYRDGRQKTMALTGAEFIRRFMQHVLPGGFVRIRHYGLHAADGLLEVCRALLAGVIASAPEIAVKCPQCGGEVVSYRSCAIVMLKQRVPP